MDRRPPGPVPVTCTRSTPSSRASLRTEGAAGAEICAEGAATAVAWCRPAAMSTTGAFGRSASTGAAGSAAGAAAAGAGAGAATAAGASAFGGSACGGAPATPTSTIRTAWPGFTLSPALTRMSLTTPASVDGTSMVALSVSSSRTDWSIFTVSPIFTSTFSTSPCATPSPRFGRTNSAKDDPCREFKVQSSKFKVQSWRASLRSQGGARAPAPRTRDSGP